MPPTAQYLKNKQPHQKMCRRSKQTILQRRHTDGQKTLEKDVQHHSLLDKCKSKPHWGTSLHHPEWPSSKSLQTINAREAEMKRKPSYSVGGNVNWCNRYGKQYGVPQKTSNRITRWSSNPTPGHLSGESHDSKRDTHPNAHCSAI